MAEIQLVQGGVVLIDDDLYEHFSQWRWRLNGKGRHRYAVRTEQVDGKAVHRIMHREIVGAPPRPEKVWVYVMAVDHPGADLVKVGISKHPHHRLRALEKERRRNLRLVHAEGPFTRKEAAAVEQMAHYVMAADRERGEWFYGGARRAVHVVCKSAIEAI